MVGTRDAGVLGGPFLPVADGLTLTTQASSVPSQVGKGAEFVQLLLEQEHKKCSSPLSLASRETGYLGDPG